MQFHCEPGYVTIMNTSDMGKTNAQMKNKSDSSFIVVNGIPSFPNFLSVFHCIILSTLQTICMLSKMLELF